MKHQMIEDWAKEIQNSSNEEQLAVIKDCVLSVRDNLEISTEDTISLLLYIDPYNIKPAMGISKEIESEVYNKARKFNYFVKFYVFNNDVYYRLDGKKTSFSYLRSYLTVDDTFGWIEFVLRRNRTNNYLYLQCVKKNIVKMKAAIIEAFVDLLNLK